LNDGYKIKMRRKAHVYLKLGGEGGIRTHGTGLPYA